MLRAVVPVAEQTDDFQDIAAWRVTTLAAVSLARPVAAGRRRRADDARRRRGTSTRSSDGVRRCRRAACCMSRSSRRADVIEARLAMHGRIDARQSGGIDRVDALCCGARRCAVRRAPRRERRDARRSSLVEIRTLVADARRRTASVVRSRRHERPPPLRAPAVLLAPLRLLRLRHRRRPGASSTAPTSTRCSSELERERGVLADAVDDRLRRRWDAVVHRSRCAAAGARGAARRRRGHASRRTRRP